MEYDELRIFEDLGIPYFSLGSYLNPQSPVDPIRPALKQAVDNDILAIAPDRNNMPVTFLNNFDTIICMHVPEWLINNWPRLRGKRVIWRTIGQSNTGVETKLAKLRKDGLQIVRYSRREMFITGNIGCDTVIPFYKDENEYKGWIGGGNEVITIAQNMKHRGEWCNYDAFEYVTRGFNRKLYGTSNELSMELSGGFLTYDGLKQKLRDARVYVYTGTQPACYTLSFIEAMMTGIPIVATGSKFGDSLNIAGKMYEIPDIIQNGVNGFVSDDLDYLRGVIQELITNKRLADRIGYLGRQTAIKLFGYNEVKARWKAFLQV